MVDILFFIILVIGVMAAQIVVELIKSFIKIKTTEKQVSAAFDTFFVKIGNAALSQLFNRKSGGEDEV